MNSPDNEVCPVLITVLSSFAKEPPLTKRRVKTFALLSTTVTSFFITLCGKFDPLRTRLEPSKREFSRMEPRGLRMKVMMKMRD